MDIVQPIIDEIKRRIDLYKNDEHVSAHTCGYLDANETLLEYIESLKKKTVDYDKLQTMLDEALEKETKESWEKFLGEEDIEKEVNNWRHQHFHGRRDKDANGEYLERTSQLDLARHFANWQKERMLKDAMPCKLGWYDCFVPEFTEEQMADVADKLKLNVGDDIKVLIVKYK